MKDDNTDILKPQSILENVSHTLLYEGYALYPYHRSAVKNQNPVPFGVVFPKDYNTYNEHAQSRMQTQCIITGPDQISINISVRFLHLKKIELFEPAKEHGDNFVPVHYLTVDGKSYQAGWQTVERTLASGDLPVTGILIDQKVIPVAFDRMDEGKYIYDESGNIAAKLINNISAIRGNIIIQATTTDIPDSFRISVAVMNTTPVENAGIVTRNEVLSESFLSTHIILKAINGVFISHQSPHEKWKAAIAGCENINTWPILIDESNSTLLSSPIILYDYPEINKQSPGDLFDSTEIEEALLLHLAVLSDDEKKRIAEGDEKLHDMLGKVSRLNPAELANFHSSLKKSSAITISTEKKSGL